MLSLHELQQAFAASMLGEHAATIACAIDDDGIAATELLRIYRNALRSNLTRTLRIVYPAVDRLVGVGFFDAAAEAFIAEHVPASGDLNEYGDEFPAFLAAFAPASALPYLADVARVEWALSLAANAPDAPALDARDMATVEPDHHALLRFSRHPSVSLLVLSYPADQIADAVLAGDDVAMAQIDLATGPVHVAIHRGAQGVEVQRLEAEAHQYLSLLYAGEPLGALLDDGSAGAPALLAQELIKGRLSTFRVAAEPTTQGHR